MVEASPPVLFAALYREEGTTGVHTHVREARRYLEECGTPTAYISSYSRGRALTIPIFGFRRTLVPFSTSAGVTWFRYWHELFLQNALRQALAQVGDCVIYAQGPQEARAALRNRQGLHQRVVMACHFRIFQADEYAEPGREEISRDGTVFRAIRQLEREVIPQVDGIVYVSRWAQNELLSWLPEASAIPSAVIRNFVTPPHFDPNQEPLGDLVTTGTLEPRKNHRFLLAVLAEAKPAGRRFTLDVFREGALRSDLERLARSLGLEGQVRFRGFRRDKCDFLPRYRACVHAASAESLPLAIIEAMAVGLPIVAGNVAGIPELCDDGVEARFWPLERPGPGGGHADQPTRLRTTALGGSERRERAIPSRVLHRRHRSSVEVLSAWDATPGTGCSAPFRTPKFLGALIAKAAAYRRALPHPTGRDGAGQPSLPRSPPKSG
jgi:glycosyltransferase involved in cell wall biosynthesis